MKKVYFVLFLLLVSVGSVQALASLGDRCSDEVLLPFVGPCRYDTDCPNGYSCDGNCVDAPSCSSGLECNNFICEQEVINDGENDVQEGYGECYDDWCCDEPGHVICDRANEICGTPEWCQNYNNPQLSCRLDDPDWCCDDAGYIIDYTSADSNSGCCPPTHPFYYKAQNNCWNAPVNTADNYYTRQSQCDYFYNPLTGSYDIDESSCTGDEVRECKLNEISQWISGWNIKGTVLGECGVECTSDSNCPADEVLNSFCNVNQIMKMTREYSCGSESKCVATDTTTVIETCPMSCEMVEGSDSELIPQCSSCAENEIIQIAEEYHICKGGSYVRVLDLVEFSSEEQQELLDQINALTSTVEEKAQLIADLTSNLQNQADIVNDLQLSINEKADLILSLTSSIAEQNELVSGLELTLKEKIDLVSALQLNIQDQANTISSLTSQAEEQATMISSLSLNIQQQSEIINEMELTVAQQTIVVENLGLNIQEQATIINNLHLNLQQKIELVSQLELTNEEQTALVAQMTLSFEDQQKIMDALNVVVENDAQQIKDLQLTISESADYIISLELTVSQQADLLSDLQLTNQQQAQLISQLELSNEDMATLISTLDVQVSDQAEIINSLNLKLDDDAEIIRNLNLQLSEEASLIDSLQLSVNQSIELISELELSINEEKELVKQLQITTQEQLDIIEGLKRGQEEFDINRLLFNIGSIRVTFLGFIISLFSGLTLVVIVLFRIKRRKR